MWLKQAGGWLLILLICDGVWALFLDEHWRLLVTARLRPSLHGCLLLVGTDHSIFFVFRMFPSFFYLIFLFNFLYEKGDPIASKLIFVLVYVFNKVLHPEVRFTLLVWTYFLIISLYSLLIFFSLIRVLLIEHAGIIVALNLVSDHLVDKLGGRQRSEVTQMVELLI